MENDKKKPTFEPVSAEEAKKIRATGNKEGRWDSGVRCESGIQDKWAACWLKTDDDPCCYWDNGQEKRGVCVVGPPPYEPEPPYPETFLRLQCKTEPWEDKR